MNLVWADFLLFVTKKNEKLQFIEQDLSLVYLLSPLFMEFIYFKTRCDVQKENIQTQTYVYLINKLCYMGIFMSGQMKSKLSKGNAQNHCIHKF